MSQEENTKQCVEMNLGGIPKGSKTSDYYRTKNIPERFDNPDWFKGYERKPVNPLYRTTNSDYGKMPPSVHTMPIVYYTKGQDFTKKLGPCGMFRNHSLNTGKDTELF